ncbi:MAG: hypothetical protein ACXWVA_05795 [Rhodoplanes sp.]|jgi:hypothetical protein
MGVAVTLRLFRGRQAFAGCSANERPAFAIGGDVAADDGITRWRG